MIRFIKRKIAASPFIVKAVEEKANLEIFKENPGLRVYFGLCIIAISYIIGWPAVALFGILAVYFGEPLLAIIGGPVIYGTSHVVFWIGFYVAGSRYAMAVLRWGVRVMFENILREHQR